MNQRGRSGWAWVTSFAVLALLVAAPAARGTLAIPWYTIDGGGNTNTTGGTFELGGTIGQPDAGVCSSGSLALNGGFWRGGAGASSLLPDPVVLVPPPVLRVLAGGPNPFVTETRFQVDLPALSPVRVAVYDPSGRMVRRLCDRTLSAGRYVVQWNGEDQAGHSLPSGAYLVRIDAGGLRTTHRLILLEGSR